MCSNYFEKHMRLARDLDDGIDKLNRTWKMPQVLIGCSGECTEETRSQIETRKIEEDLINMKEYESQSSESIDQLLKETEATCESLKEHCDNLETVFAEYGYHYYKNDTLDLTNGNSNDQSNQHSTEGLGYLEVEFTPNLGWKCKIKQSEQSTPLSNTSSVLHTTTTSLINNVSQILEDTSITYKNSLGTPIRERPQEPSYSKHFYKVLKK
ncbi:uncharacterized protein LOC143372810 isoform X2 [Andrena cerasifolii]|uniref:uncharacterized protein LOC143372810 isoform X2 n=1 Tax=Andrena cerasifolii TaxID=2819439 RepID=UPI0040377A5A